MRNEKSRIKDRKNILVYTFIKNLAAEAPPVADIDRSRECSSGPNRDLNTTISGWEGNDLPLFLDDLGLRQTLCQ